MKKSLMIALAATGLTLGGAAIAQDQMRGGGDMTRADVETRTAERFARMDVNGDGLLNPADREARALERFNAADTNNDGALTFEESQAAREAHRETRQARRAERGEQAGERRGRRGNRMGRRGGRMGGGERGQMMQQADADGDGSISQAEFTTSALARFDAADANSDGTLTAEERRAQRGERRGGRGRQ